MLKKFLVTLLSGSMLIQGAGFPVLANEQEPEIEEIEDFESIIEELDDEETEEIYEEPIKEVSQEIIFPEDGEIVKSGTLGEGPNAPTWKIDSNGTLTIGEGEFENNDPQFNWPWRYTDVPIERVNGKANFVAKGCYAYAFSSYGPTNLSSIERITAIDLSGWNTSQVTNMEGMFYGCLNLNSLILSSQWNTSKVTTMSAMFADCVSLTSLDLSKWNTSKVKNMSWMFSNTSLSSLDSLNISDLNTSSVTDMSYMFYQKYDWSSFKVDLNLSKWNTSSVINMCSMFENCGDLNSLNLSGWNTSQVKNMSKMFSNCKNLTLLNCSGWKTSSLTEMESIFSECSSLTSLDLLHWDTSSVHSFSSLFWRCSSLESLKISTWKVSNVTNMNDMFGGCSSLKSLNLLNWNTANVTQMIQMFEKCSSLTSLDISNWEVGKVTSMESMFYECSSLTSLDISNWEVGKVTSIESMFYKCSSLTSLDLSKWKVSNVVTMRKTFFDCSSLTSLDISDWDVAKVENMQDMFSGCSSLTSLNLSHWNPAKLNDMGGMFAGCSSLTSLDLSNWDSPYFGTMEYMFKGCSSLNSLNLFRLYTDEDKVIKGMYINNMFEDCSALISLDLSNWDTSSINRSYRYNFWPPNIYLIKYNDLCENLIFDLGDNSGDGSYTLDLKWYQNGEGPYKVKDIPSLFSEEQATLIREDYIGAITKPTPNPDPTPTPTSPGPDYIELLKEFDPKTYYKPIAVDFPSQCWKALINDKNFLASHLVALKDSSFGTDCITAMSNLYFRGIPGWKEQFFNTESIKASKDILIGLLKENSQKFEEVAFANSAISNGKKLINGLQTFMAGEMINQLLGSGAMEALKEKVNSSKSESEFLNLLISGNTQKITDYLAQGTNLNIDQITSFVDKFYDSSEFIESLGDIFKIAGKAFKGVKITANILTKLLQFQSLANANEDYFEFLDYVSKNCHYKPMSKAAQELKNSLKDYFSFLIDSFADDVMNFGLDKALDTVTSLLPPVKLGYKALGIAQSIANGFFNISGKQEAYDKLRAITYLNKTLSVWSGEKQSEFIRVYWGESSGNLLSVAESYLSSLNLLYKGRIKGEQLLQKYLSDSGLIGSSLNNTQAINESKKIEMNTKQNAIYFDLEGKGYLTLAFACPIEISLLDENKDIILTLNNEKEVEGKKDIIYYSVSKNPVSNDYIKLISIPEDSKFSIQAIGTDNGVVDYSCLGNPNEEGILQVYSVNNIPVDKGDTLTVSSLAPASPLTLNSKNSSEPKTYTPINQTDKTEEPTGISLSLNQVSLKIGEKQKVIPTLTPVDAIPLDVSWTSDNESIATVNNDGVITALSTGETIIKATTLNGVSATVKVTVKNNSISGNLGNSGGGGGGGSIALPTQTNEMYRLYNPNSGEHFYTTDQVEKDHLATIGWKYEGIGWKAPTTSNTPVYRLYNENAGDHHYTTDKNEKDTLVRIGWKDEKIGWYSDDQKGVPLYRVYNPNAQAGSHHYTTDKTEQDYLVGIGWNNEGIAWHGIK